MELSLIGGHDLRLKHPFTLLLAGPTGSGKTQLIIRLLNNYQHTTTIRKERIKLLFCYGIWQESYKLITNPNIDITFHEGFCFDYDEMRPDVLVLDDLMNEIANDKKLTAAFTKTSHHLNISVIFITQNVFHQSKQMRTISLNSHYIILMKAPRDKMQIMTLGRQIYPINSKFFMQAYEEAVKEPYGHLIIDMTSTTDDNLRLRQRKTMNGKEGYEIYMPKN